MLSIGEFSNICKVSTKTLRYYAEIGLLEPSEVNPENGYRYKEVELDNIDKIIVYKIDRFSRNITDFFNVYEQLKKHHCGFESALERFDTTTPHGKLFLTILASFAELERESISQRVRDSYYFRAKNDGRWLGGKPPFGFDKCKNPDGKSSLKPNKLMDLVIELYNKYSRDTNVSLHQLVTFAREKYDIKISVTQINNILSNTAYVIADKLLYEYYKLKNVNFVNDISEFDKTHAMQIVNRTNQSGKEIIRNDSSLWVCYLTNWQGVIPSRTFIDVQERLKENKSYTSSNTPNNLMKELTSLVKCEKCGMSVRIKGKYGTLSCIGRSEYRGYCNASFRGIRLPEIQEQVAIELQTYFDNFSSEVKKEELEKRALEVKIADLKRKIEEMFDMMLDDEVVRKAGLNKVREMQTELSEAEIELLNYNVATDKVEERVLKHAIHEDGEIIYKNLTTEKKQTLLKILVKKVFLSEDGSVRIEWKNKKEGMA